MITQELISDVELTTKLSVVAQYSINLAAALTTELTLTECGRIMSIIGGVESEMVDYIITNNLDLK
jgi:hypothetical protein